MSKEHELKCWPEYFTEVIAGRKPFEIRKDDRGFWYGDTLYLREWHPTEERYTGRECKFKVTAAYRNVPGLLPDHVAMTIARPTQETSVEPRFPCAYCEKLFLTMDVRDHHEEGCQIVRKGHFWRSITDRFICHNCGDHYDKHLHTDEANLCPPAASGPDWRDENPEEVDKIKALIESAEK